MKYVLYASAIALGLGITTPAAAQLHQPLIAPTTGDTYFNRPGATMDDHRADLEACRAGVFNSQQPVQSTGAGAAFGLVGALVEAGISASAQQRAQLRSRAPLYESCMVLRGWRVVRVSEARGAELAALEQQDLAQRLAPLIGAENPEGEIARSYANEASRVNEALFGVAPSNDGNSLSLLALPPDIVTTPNGVRPTPEPTRPDRAGHTTAQYNARMAQYREQRPIYNAEQAAHRASIRDAALQLAGPGRVAQRTRARAVSAIAQDATVLVIHVSGTHHQSGLMLTRMESQAGEIDTVSAIVPAAFVGGVKEDTIVAVVPPGRWRLSAFSGLGGYALSLCMGAPSFEVSAGEVVYAGGFLFGGDGPRLDMTLAPAHAALANTPHLAERVRAAEYRNGETFACGATSNFYNYEIDGAPFVEGYGFGSRANIATVVAAPPELDVQAESEAEPAP